MQEHHSHQTVLLEEAVQALAVHSDGFYLDATFGRGGHSAAILSRLGPYGRLLALDRDPAAEQYARERFADDPRFQFERVRFARLGEIVARLGWRGLLRGVLLDLGVSSPQLDDPQRGFSFAKDGPLDMRMDPQQEPSAAAWLATVSEAELARVFKELGEERFHRRIAHAIVATRVQTPITTTLQLARIIASSVPTREPGKHPATRCFQAIRIAVNRELEELQTALEQALYALAAGGRLVVISFHSLEDRIVKRFMRRRTRGEELPPGIPLPATLDKGMLRIVERARRPSAAEIASNPRARSAILRTAERLA